jgi:hypothetical protein
MMIWVALGSFLAGLAFALLLWVTIIALREQNGQ